MPTPNQPSGNLPPLGGETTPATIQETPMADPPPVKESTGVDDLFPD